MVIPSSVEDAATEGATTHVAHWSVTQTADVLVIRESSSLGHGENRPTWAVAGSIVGILFGIGCLIGALSGQPKETWLPGILAVTGLVGLGMGLLLVAERRAQRPTTWTFDWATDAIWCNAQRVAPLSDLELVVLYRSTPGSPPSVVAHLGYWLLGQRWKGIGSAGVLTEAELLILGQRLADFAERPFVTIDQEPLPEPLL